MAAATFPAGHLTRGRGGACWPSFFTGWTLESLNYETQGLDQKHSRSDGLGPKSIAFGQDPKRQDPGGNRRGEPPVWGGSRGRGGEKAGEPGLSHLPHLRP